MKRDNRLFLLLYLFSATKWRLTDKLKNKNNITRSLKRFNIPLHGLASFFSY